MTTACAERNLTESGSVQDSTATGHTAQEVSIRSSRYKDTAFLHRNKSFAFGISYDFAKISLWVLMGYHMQFGVFGYRQDSQSETIQLPIGNRYTPFSDK